MTATALVMARSGSREPMAQTRATARWSLTICQAIDVWETLGRSMPKGRWTACTRPQATTAFRDRRHLHAEIGRRKPLFPNDDRCIQCIVERRPVSGRLRRSRDCRERSQVAEIGRGDDQEAQASRPGEVLREEFLIPIEMSAGAVAKVCGLPRTRIERIASEQTGITADTALRVAKALDTTPEIWLNLQTDYDVQIARRDVGKALDRIETVNKSRAA
ncbi:HigA family addiction module antitoxin [Bradyrhizobium sp. SZCCHNRI2007]|uniref:HigA family addiction module antitoxin n=1 Tax=unclassified Bradyrhizobium TaxID=2631580 RepID=UPI00396575A0